MKYWEIIADNLARAGWTYGVCGYFLDGKKMWIADAHKAGSGSRFIVRSDDILSAFLELETQCRKAEVFP